MARKKEVFVLTHTEIYALAIRSIDADIAEWRKRCEGLPEEHFNDCVSHLMEKREALKQLYKLECGNDYD